MKRKARAVLLTAVFLAAGTAAAHSQSDYPSRPVRVIVPFAPGGVVDVMARILTQKLTDAMGKSFYIDNVGGAGGNIGTRNAAASPKDGYTILISSSSQGAIRPREGFQPDLDRRCVSQRPRRQSP
jgi:tripartite-type tricarboxylate transporter receptor subunit TctC